MALIDRVRWRVQVLLAAWRVMPIAGADDDPPEDDPKKDDPKATDDPDSATDDPKKDDPNDDKEIDWKKEARKHERRAKKAAQEAAEHKRKLEEKEGEDQTEQERAIEAAKKEAREEALSEAEKERRSDRLEVAVTRLAAKGVEVGEGDDAKTLRFDDPEDALVFIERGIDKGDIDADDIFDDEGKVKTDALTDELIGLLKSKPRLAADAAGRKAAGDADTRKGSTATKDLEAMSPEDHARRKYGEKK